MTPPQAGRALGIETLDVLWLIDGGDLPLIKGYDGMIYVSEEAVQAYADKHR
jgi:hypothetical protein